MGNNIDREELLNQKIIFCTQCDAELENYCFQNSSNDIEAIKMNLVQCKKKGKFTGEFCSKLFIAGNENLEAMFRIEEE